MAKKNNEEQKTKTLGKRPVKKAASTTESKQETLPKEETTALSDKPIESKLVEKKPIAKVVSTESKPESSKSVKTNSFEADPAVKEHDGLQVGRCVSHDESYDGCTRRIAAMDEPEFGGQHEYMLEIQKQDLGIIQKLHREDLKFQKGSLAEHGPNGWSEGDLVKILIDRLKNFESGDGPGCPENKEAISGLLAAHNALDKRRKRKLQEIKEKQQEKSKVSAIKPIIY